MFEIVTGRTPIDSAMGDRVTSIAGIIPHIGPPPTGWIDDIDDETREKIAKTSLKPLDIGRYLQLAYDQDYKEILGLEDSEEEFLLGNMKSPCVNLRRKI